MWKLIKTEYRYFGKSLIWLYLFALPFLILNVLVKDFQDDLARVMIFMLPILGIVMKYGQESFRRERLLVSLPLPVRQIAVARHAVWLGFWISLMLLFAGSIWIGSGSLPRGHALYSLFALGNGMIILAACASLLQDCAYSTEKRAARNVWKTAGAFLIAIAIALYIVVSAAELRPAAGIQLLDYVLTPGFSFISGVLAVIFLYFAVRTYVHRLSYLD